MSTTTYYTLIVFGIGIVFGGLFMYGFLELTGMLVEPRDSDTQEFPERLEQ